MNLTTIFDEAEAEVLAVIDEVMAAFDAPPPPREELRAVFEQMAASGDVAGFIERYGQELFDRELELALARQERSEV